MEVRVTGDGFEVVASTLGAELQSVKFRGKERLWQNGDGSWQGRSPVLFPVCGACEMRVDGTVYPCPRHGFAKDLEFSLAERTEHLVRFRLTGTEELKKLYPYDFVFEVAYQIEGGVLSVGYAVYNTGEKDLYFSCGGHDSFALDCDLQNYELQFEREEEFESFLVNGQNGKLTGKTQPLGRGTVLNLSTPLLEKSNSVCLKPLSRAVRLREKETGKTVAEISFPQSDKLVLWRPDGAKMLCIEPWQTLPDFETEPCKEFSEKDGVIRVPPHGKREVVRKLKYE